MYNTMKMISTTEARKHISLLVEDVFHNKKSYVIGRYNEPEAVLIPFPKHFSDKVSEITLFAANSGSFDFLADEPDLYGEKR